MPAGGDAKAEALSSLRDRIVVIEGFGKRTYRGPREWLADIFFLAKNIGPVWRVMRRKPVSAAFRERLMLAVTSVYGCRYCAWGHSREALRSGVGGAEIRSLLAGNVSDCPEDEAIALLYAQHWADSDARPDPDAAANLERTYGLQKAEAINLLLRMIRVGNLSGNTWDRFLHAISRGRWGGTRRTQPA